MSLQYLVIWVMLVFPALFEFCLLWAFVAITEQISYTVNTTGHIRVGDINELQKNQAENQACAN